MTICYSHETAFRFWTAATNAIENSSLLLMPQEAPSCWPDTVEPNDVVLESSHLIPELAHAPAPLHVLVFDPKHCYRGSTVVRHKSSYRLPEGCVRFLDDERQRVLVVSAEMAAVQLAQSLPFADLVKHLYILCGVYGPRADDPSKMGKRLEVTTVSKLAVFARKHPEFLGSVKLTEALRYVTDRSASARETALSMLLTMPTRCGGYGLPLPLLNHGFAIPQWAQTAEYRNPLACDLYWPNARLALEYDSREWHSDEAKKERDAARSMLLSVLGVEVHSIRKTQVDSEEHTRAIAMLVARRLGKRVRPRGKNFDAACKRLREIVLG